MYVCIGKDSPGSESDGADSRSETESEIQPKKVNSHIIKTDKYIIVHFKHFLHSLHHRNGFDVFFR